MSPRCCGGAASATSTVVLGSEKILVTGTGTAADPYVITAAIGMTSVANTHFSAALTGSGTPTDPWGFSVEYASSAKLDDIPDVNAPAPTNGQVLAYDTASSSWKPAAPAVASPGLINHDTSLNGDGSVGSPLAVKFDPLRYLAGSTAGAGISDLGHQQLVRHFVDAAARTAANPIPVLNALSMLDTAPGLIDYWTGTVWKQYRSMPLDVVGEFLQLSGPYSDTTVKVYVRQIDTTTDVNGVFDAIPAASLTGYAGILHVQFQQVDLGPTPLTPTFTVSLKPVTGAGAHVQGIAYRADDGLPYQSQHITGTLFAHMY